MLLSAPLRPLTPHRPRAGGSQPKSPQPISAGRHLFIVGGTDDEADD